MLRKCNMYDIIHNRHATSSNMASTFCFFLIRLFHRTSLQLKPGLLKISQRKPWETCWCVRGMSRRNINVYYFKCNSLYKCASANAAQTLITTDKHLRQLEQQSAKRTTPTDNKSQHGSAIRPSLSRVNYLFIITEATVHQRQCNSNGNALIRSDRILIRDVSSI